MNLRIQQGRLRGRRIPAPPEIKGQAHFTPALLKEAAFQIFDNHCDPARTVFFDLCAGSGQMGFEAYSRGYRQVMLFEVDPGRLALLRKTAAEFRPSSAESELVVQRRDLRRSAGRILEAPAAAVFLDPPYSFWNDDQCPPVADLIRTVAQQAPALLQCLFVVQGPAALGAVPGLPPGNTHRHGNHWLSVFAVGFENSAGQR